MNNLGLMHKKLNWQGGNQENRMIKDKYKSMLRSLDYSYQAADVKKVGEDETRRALINPDKNKNDYDDKILSIDYAYEYKPGDIFEWVGTSTYWLIYLQELTELAYFRSEIRRCKYQLKWIHNKQLKTSWCYVRGPVETKIDAIQKNGISTDVPNWSLNIYLPDSEDNRECFNRYSRFVFDGMAWEVQVVDRISVEGVLEIVALEHFTDKAADDLENSIADAVVIEPVREDLGADNIIVGEGFITPKVAEKYTCAAVGGVWSVKENRPVALTPVDDGVLVKWTKATSGTFTLVYTVGNVVYEKMIVVESLF